jgi:hypothetical protein
MPPIHHSPSVSRSATPLLPHAPLSKHAQHQHQGEHLLHPLHTFCPAHEFAGQSLLTVDKLTKEQLNTIFYVAHYYLTAFKHQKQIEPVLKVSIQDQHSKVLLNHRYFLILLEYSFAYK